MFLSMLTGKLSDHAGGLRNISINNLSKCFLYWEVAQPGIPLYFSLNSFGVTPTFDLKTVEK